MSSETHVSTEKQIFQSEPMFLCRLGEVMLKGLNRRRFEERIESTLRRRLGNIGSFRVSSAQSRIRCYAKDEDSRKHLSAAVERARTVFGLVSVSPAVEYPAATDIEVVGQAACHYIETYLGKDALMGKRFKVETRRGNKQFPLNSQEISREIGGHILSRWPRLKVDVHQPDFILYCELRDELTFYHEILPAAKGLPVGSSGRGLLLLSGGIDSPVAGYMMASRGLRLEAIYFHTYPYTSDQALDKVKRLAALLSVYSGRLKLHVVDFTEAQLELNQVVPADMLTVVMRRMMLRVADRLASSQNIDALVTGESLGQVASQTVEALNCTDSVAKHVIFRPLIGLDKDATIAIARDIDTFETSILPYEDCCTVFVAKHPRIHPKREEAERAEEKIDIEAMIQNLMGKISSEEIGPERL